MAKQKTPTASLVITPSTIRVNTQASLSWNTQFADTVRINNGLVSKSGVMPISGSIGTHLYSLVASNRWGSVSKQAILNVTGSLPNVNLVISPDVIHEGFLADLSWLVSNAQEAKLNGSNVSFSGNLSVVGTVGDHSFNLVARNLDGETSKQVMLSVVNIISTTGELI